MKRFYLFFASVILIMASDIFVGCKMNGGGNGNNQSGQNTPDATYGFVPATEYTLVYEDGDTGKPYAGQKFKGSVLIAIAKELGLSTDSYTIDEANKKVTILTGKQLYDYLVDPSEEVAEKLTEIINGENNNGIDEPPVTTNEYTVSVASGIKGGHIEVSLDNATWTTLSTSIKYAKNTKLYVRAVADKHYKYSSGIDESVITITENKTLNATFEIVKETLGSVIVTTTLEINEDLSNSKYIVEVLISDYKFNAGWNKAKIALGFDEDYYYGLTETSLVDGPKYYYAYPTEISTFNDTYYSGTKAAYVGINGENFEIPDVGKFYLVLENNNQTELYEMATSKFNGPNHFRVEVK